MRTFVALSLAAVALTTEAKLACPTGHSYLTVEVISADVTRCTDPTTDPDPYVIVAVMDDTAKNLYPLRTKIVGNSKTPEWRQKLDFGCVVHDSPIVFQVKDHDFQEEEVCLGPIELQGWPESGTVQSVCSTSASSLLGKPTDCLNFAVNYVRGHSGGPADTTSDGESAIAGISPRPPTTGPAVTGPAVTPLPAQQPTPSNEAIPVPAPKPVPQPMPQDPIVDAPKTEDKPVPVDPIVQQPEKSSPSLKESDSSSSGSKRFNLRGDKLAGAVAGSLVALAVLATAVVALVISIRRSRSYQPQINEGEQPRGSTSSAASASYIL